ncbi:MAG: spermidine/putrescine ABC transporter permease [Candidatus Reconcilbacillus cellulovorans]|uniref:Spermidine/putrescine ABC transporter permease n=1 Tax=Candidatus Reconcilbacillus cellulovorans TaxID=1906605 RepID=A0A2A6DZ13_9BACL|nr:MAG: spermidine/putrescine ABC transporter permease [Candidatus Reconcilbacillus cellulovorans]
MNPDARLRGLRLYAWAVVAFLYAPIALIVLYSFNASRFSAAWGGWTWKWYASLFRNDLLLEATRNSLMIAVANAFAATCLGTLAALGAHALKRRARAAARGVFYLPILVPDIVMGLSLLVLFSRLAIPLGKWTVLAAHVTFSLAYVYVLVAARLEARDPRLEEAAQDLGADRWRTFRHVTLPLLSPAVVAGALVSFTLSIDDFMITFFVSGPESTTLPLYVYGLVRRGISPEVSALSTLLVVLTAVLVALAERFRRRP